MSVLSAEDEHFLREIPTTENIETHPASALVWCYKASARIEELVLEMAGLGVRLDSALKARDDWIARAEAMTELLRRIRKWDMLDSAASGLRTEIDAVLAQCNRKT